VGETAFPQYFEMLRDGRLRDAELVLNHLDDGARSVLALRQQLKDAPPNGIAKNIKSVRQPPTGASPV
jgi:hypothetical protein